MVVSHIYHAEALISSRACSVSPEINKTAALWILFCSNQHYHSRAKNVSESVWKKKTHLATYRPILPEHFLRFPPSFCFLATSCVQSPSAPVPESAVILLLWRYYNFFSAAVTSKAGLWLQVGEISSESRWALKEQRSQRSSSHANVPTIRENNRGEMKRIIFFHPGIIWMTE